RDDAGFVKDVERLDPQPVPDQMQLPGIAIPDSQGKHPNEPSYSPLHTPGFKPCQHYFRIGMPPEAVAVSCQLSAHLSVIEHLAVENEGVSPTGRSHRLMALGRQVDDREPTKSQRDPAIGIPPHPATIPTAI